MITPVILLPAIFLSVVFWTLLTHCFPAKWSRMFCTFVCVGACFAILLWPFALFFFILHLKQDKNMVVGMMFYLNNYDSLLIIPLTPVSLLFSLCGYGLQLPSQMSLLLFKYARPLLATSFNAMQIHCPIVHAFFTEESGVFQHALKYVITSGAHAMRLIGYE